MTESYILTNAQELLKQVRRMYKQAKQATGEHPDYDANRALHIELCGENNEGMFFRLTGKTLSDHVLDDIADTHGEIAALLDCLPYAEDD